MHKIVLYSDKKTNPESLGKLAYYLVNELKYPVTQAEQLMYLLTGKGEVTVYRSEDPDKIMSMVNRLEDLKIKYEVENG